MQEECIYFFSSTMPTIFVWLSQIPELLQFRNIEFLKTRAGMILIKQLLLNIGAGCRSRSIIQNSSWRDGEFVKYGNFLQKILAWKEERQTINMWQHIIYTTIWIVRLLWVLSYPASHPNHMYIPQKFLFLWICCKCLAW